jgi:hypothetical protein
VLLFVTAERQVNGACARGRLVSLMRLMCIPFSVGRIHGNISNRKKCRVMRRRAQRRRDTTTAHSEHAAKAASKRRMQIYLQRL